MATVIGGTPPFVPTGGSGGMLSSLAGALSSRFNPTVNIRTQTPDAIQRKRDATDWAVQQALQPGRGQGAGVGLSKLAVALMARHKNKGLDAAEAQNKAKQGELVKALLAASQKGEDLSATLAGMDMSSPLAQQIAISQIGKKPTEKFEIVKDPYGKGGFGQRSSTTGKIVDYQAAPEKFESVKDPYGMGGMGQVSTRTGKISGYQKPDKPEGLVNVRSPDGSINAYRKNDPQLDSAIASGGVQVGLNIEGGRSDVFSPTKKTTDQLQKSLLSSNENLARIENMAGMFDPDYLTYQTKIEQGALKMAEKFGVDVGEQGREKITEISKFKRGAIENLNLYIKEITGAQMSEAEANRLRKAVPDAETDSPTEFKAKMDDAIVQLRKKQARHAYALENGIAPESLHGQEDGPWSQASATGGTQAATPQGQDYSAMSDEDIKKELMGY